MSRVLLLVLGLGALSTPAPVEPTSPRTAAAPVHGQDDEQALEPYRETIPGTDVGFDLVPIPGGHLWLGSPEEETGRRQDEGPRQRVEIEPFWMATTEVTWNLFHLYQRHSEDVQPAGADAVSRPTRPYVPMDFGMGTDGFPAISMTQFAARHFTKWLSGVTGRFYRLPTEAEWEYACRAGSETAYGFGDDPAELDRYGWHRGNSEGGYRQVGQLEPNPWGLYDLHGNVAEWTLDQYRESGYRNDQPPVVWPTTEYQRVVRGGSYRDPPEELRCAARQPSRSSWKLSDPQFPQSIWYLTDAPFVGLRVVRPLREPTAEERERAWEPDLDSIRRILERQAAGG